SSLSATRSFGGTSTHAHASADREEHDAGELDQEAAPCLRPVGHYEDQGHERHDKAADAPKDALSECGNQHHEAANKHQREADERQESSHAYPPCYSTDSKGFLRTLTLAATQMSDPSDGSRSEMPLHKEPGGEQFPRWGGEEKPIQFM